MTKLESSAIDWLCMEQLSDLRWRKHLAIRYPFLSRDGCFQLEGDVSCHGVLLSFRYIAYEKQTGKEVVVTLDPPSEENGYELQIRPLDEKRGLNVWDYHKIEYQPDFGYLISQRHGVDASNFYVCCAPDRSDAWIITDINPDGSFNLEQVAYKEAIRILKAYPGHFLSNKNLDVTKWPKKEFATLIGVFTSRINIIDHFIYAEKREKHAQIIVEKAASVKISIPAQLARFFTFFPDGVGIMETTPFSLRIFSLKESYGKSDDISHPDELRFADDDFESAISPWKYTIATDGSSVVRAYDYKTGVLCADWESFSEWLCDMLMDTVPHETLPGMQMHDLMKTLKEDLVFEEE